MNLTEKQEKILEGKKIFFATPCYGGVVTEGWANSCFNTIQSLIKNKIPYTFQTIGNESLITRGRNTLVHKFLESDRTHLFFIDADIEYRVEDVYRLLLADKPVVVGSYPMKSINWSEIEYRSSIGIHKNLEGFSPKNVVNFNIKTNEKGQSLVSVKDGLIELLDAGTGFMMIKREAIEKMIENYQNLAYKTDTEEKGKQINETHYALFDTIIEEDTGRYLSEDYTFCRRWQKIGGKIWLHPDIVLNHIGTYRFRGGDVKRLLKKSD